MSGGILVVAEHARGQLSDTTRQAVAAAIELRDAGAGSVQLAVVASDPGSLQEAAALEGVETIIEVSVPTDEFNADLIAAALEALVRDRAPAIVLMGLTSNSMSVAPVVAARCGHGFASDVIAVELASGSLVARRQFYGGKIEAELDFPGHASVILLLRPSIWAPAEAGGRPDVTVFDAEIDEAGVRMRHREFVDPPLSDLDITKADVIVAIGRGVGEREDVSRLEALAERMGVTLAASRPLVDAGWVPKARQVGQSGVTVKPRLYVALGISGAVQHLIGMRGSGTIVAVNKDPNAAIFSVADFGAVEDLFDVVEELEKLW